MLLVELVQIAVVVAGGQVAIPFVGRPGKAELIARLGSTATDSAGRAAGNAEVFAIGGVTLAYLLELTCIEGQAGDLQRIQVPALKGLWQQARIVCLDGWQSRLQRA
mgnify:CR=1 FL=1